MLMTHRTMTIVPVKAVMTITGVATLHTHPQVLLVLKMVKARIVVILKVSLYTCTYREENIVKINDYYEFYTGIIQQQESIGNRHYETGWKTSI